MCVIRVSSKLKNSLAPPLRWSTTILLWTPALFQLYGLFRTRQSWTGSKQKDGLYLMQGINKEVECITVSVIPLFYQISAILWLINYDNPQNIQRAQSTVNVIFDFLIILVVWRHQRMTYHHHDPLRLPLVFFLLLLILLQNDHPFSV